MSSSAQGRRRKREAHRDEAGEAGAEEVQEVGMEIDANEDE